MAHALELGLIGSAWHGTSLGVLEGIAKTKEIGFDSYDVFELLSLCTSCVQMMHK